MSVTERSVETPEDNSPRHSAETHTWAELKERVAQLHQKQANAKSDLELSDSPKKRAELHKVIGTYQFVITMLEVEVEKARKKEDADIEFYEEFYHACQANLDPNITSQMTGVAETALKGS